MAFLRVNLPNKLTLIRFLLSPLLFPAIILYLLPLDFWFINVLIFLIFLMFCLTDFFDGYYARKLGQESEIGALLDPIADKLLLCSTLIPLVAIGRLHVLWSVIFIGREFFVMGLRLLSSRKQIDIPVSLLGKIKMFCEMVYIALLLIQDSAHQYWLYEYLFLILSLGSSIISAYYYFISVYREFDRFNVPHNH